MLTVTVHQAIRQKAKELGTELEISPRWVGLMVEEKWQGQLLGLKMQHS